MTHNTRIAVARTFGAPDVIGIEETRVPHLSGGAVLVAVRASGVNPVDARRRSGSFGGQPPLTFGGEFAGTVVASEDPAWAAGDDVIGWGVVGAHADLVVADDSRLIAKPESVSWALAGGFGGVSRTSITALDALSLQRGDTIMIHGASGGVGTVLAQLGIARGLRIIGSASESNQEYLRGIGVTPVVYGEGLSDAIAEAADGAPITASIDLAGTHEAGEIAAAVMRAGGQAITLVPETVSSHGIQLVQSRSSLEQMRTLVQALTDGTIDLPVETIPFTHIAEAHRRLDAKHARGKLVLEFSDNPHLATL